MRKDRTASAAITTRGPLTAGTLLCLAALGSTLHGAGQPESDRVQLRLDSQVAREVLAILDTPWAKPGVAPPDPQRLFSTPGYTRLKAREAAMQRPFTDAEFMDFVRSNGVRSQEDALKRTLSEWEGADMQEAVRRALFYLPEEATIKATVYLMIKPRTNSFVWDVQTDPAIFLYLDPNVSQAQFANTVAHELHHIGYASIKQTDDAQHPKLSEQARTVAKWVGAFGEGFAMLAAAGGPDVHPHAASPEADRTRWDKDVAGFNQDVQQVGKFFADILKDRLSPKAIQDTAASFYGIQGPWYTVGWKMAVVIEKRFGRPELIRCMSDPWLLLERYNAAAAELNTKGEDKLATWPESLLNALKGTDGRQAALGRP